MTNRIETALLDYLNFRPAPSEHHSFLWHANEDQWRQALAFADTAGLTLFLRTDLKRSGDFRKLPVSIQRGLEQRFQDNQARTSAICQELIELNRLLQAQRISYLNLKGQILYPDFVGRREDRLQYDHDFLIRTEDLERAYTLFLSRGYTPLPSSPKLAVGHLPTLVRKTAWEWRGNLYDPAIPRAVELHFRLWESEFDRIPIHTLENVWLNSRSTPFQSLSLPALSAEHTLLYGVLHAFRHLLRNDLRLSHLYEIGFFLHQQSNNSSFWQGFFHSIATCSRSCRAVAMIFELSCRTFGAEPGLMVRQFVIDHLSPAAALWIESYAVEESIHCYRRSKSALLLHLDFVDGFWAKGLVTRRKLIPRHLPLSSFGVQPSARGREAKFPTLKLMHDANQFLRRLWFHASALSRLSAQLPLWTLKLCLRKAKYSRATASENPLLGGERRL